MNAVTLSVTMSTLAGMGAGATMHSCKSAWGKEMMVSIGLVLMILSGSFWGLRGTIFVFAIAWLVQILTFFGGIILGVLVMMCIERS